LQQHLCKSVECLYLIGAGIGVGRTFRSLISGVSIPHPKDAYRTGNGYRQVVAGSGDKTFLFVLQLNITHCHIPIVCLNDGTVCRQGDTGRSTGSLHSTGQYFFAVLIAYSLHCTGLENGFPGKMAVSGHRFAIQFLAVHSQFHFIAVAVYPNVDAITFVTLQIPVRKDVQHRLIRPPGLQIPGFVLGEATVVQNAEL